jgi:hypothetical protein
MTLIKFNRKNNFREVSFTLTKALYLCIFSILVNCQVDNNNSENGIGATLNGSCWCTNYVAHEIGIIHYPDAYKWSVNTLGSDFTIADNPIPGDVIVMNKYYNGVGEVGHVGIVKSVVNGNNDDYTITIHGANQPGIQINECNCDNVSDWIRVVKKNDIANGKLSFYRRYPLAFSCFQPENILPSPKLISPIQNETVTSVQLKWHTVSNAYGYLIEVDGNQININSGSTVSYDPTLNNGMHQWRICAKNSSGGLGGWSSLETFFYEPVMPSEICNGIDDNSDGIIDNLGSCWVSIYRFKDPKSGARCWNNSAIPPSGCQDYIYEIEAWVCSSCQLPNTFQIVQCSKQTDHILVEKNSNDYNSLINSGYHETVNLGYVWRNNSVSHSNNYFAIGYKVCKVYRFSYTTTVGTGAHFFTRGADNLTNMNCELPARFEVITNQNIFNSPPCQ